MSKHNSRVILASRPGFKLPQESNYRHEPCDYPSEDLQPGEVLIKNCYLSVDPAQRCQMNDKMSSGVDYIDVMPLGQVIMGLNGSGVIVKSADKDFSEGDYVMGGFNWPWQEYFVLNVRNLSGLARLMKLDKGLLGGDLSLSLSLYGIPGHTALLGIQVKGGLKHGANQTLVVSGAAGSCGTLAGQFGRLEGASNVVGICGSQKKCDWITKELGFNSAINYKTENVAARLKETCPGGIDSYFDNVGGQISAEVIKQMNRDSHIVLCGQIEEYNKDLPYPPPIAPETEALLKEKNITRDRFIYMNYPDKFTGVIKQLSEWYSQKKFKVGVTMAEGLANAGNAFISMMSGGNLGKQLVHVADP